MLITGLRGVGKTVLLNTFGAIAERDEQVGEIVALGEAAARLNRWEFMLTINPMPVAGGTGFPLNAIAMF